MTYRSPYEEYPFLSDAADDIRCDFEIFTDRMASFTGLLAADVPERREELLKIDELIYHANPTLRTFFSITDDEIEWLKARIAELKSQTAGRCERFVLPAGSHRASLAHILRTDGKALTRMAYRYYEGHADLDTRLIDLTNLISGYFFYLALWLNAVDGVDEIPFESRNYK